MEVYGSAMKHAPKWNLGETSDFKQKVTHRGDISVHLKSQE